MGPETKARLLRENARTFRARKRTDPLNADSWESRALAAESRARRNFAGVVILQSVTAFKRYGYVYLTGPEARSRKQVVLELTTDEAIELMEWLSRATLT